MKKFTVYIAIVSWCLFTLMACSAQKIALQKLDNDMVSKSTEQYDSLLAQKYGADDYGMKKYVVAFLKRGPNRDFTEEKAAELQNAHLENIGKLAEEGKLLLAGPFFGDGDLRGIYIFDVRTIEEAEALTNTDPAIKAGSLVMELKPWYGSAAVMAINEIHEKLVRKSIMGE